MLTLFSLKHVHMATIIIYITNGYVFDYSKQTTMTYLYHTYPQQQCQGRDLKHG